MLPSERAERRVKRIGVIVLIIMALIFLTWMIGLLLRALRGSLEQRKLPEESNAPAVYSEQTFRRFR